MSDRPQKQATINATLLFICLLVQTSSVEFKFYSHDKFADPVTHLMVRVMGFLMT